MTTLVFVYGTLRRGEGNHRLLAHAEHVGDGWTVDLLTMVNLGWFPAVIVGPAGGGPSTIRGEVYAVDDNTLHRLDSLEGYPYHYDRREFEIRLDDGRTVSAWMYYQRPDRQRAAEVIATGDWHDRTPAMTTDN